VNSQGFGIVDPVVAENGAAGSDHVFIADEPIPIIVTDFMPEMAKDCAIRFVHRRTPFLTFGVVRFRQHDCNSAIFVPRHRHRTIRRRTVGRKVESEANRAFIACLEREVKTKQTVEQTVLGKLYLAPERDICLVRQVRDRRIVPARCTENFARIRVYQPVAAIVFGVRAKSI
jgi:hypothetical protein